MGSCLTAPAYLIVFHRNSSSVYRCHGDLVPPCVLVPRVPNHRRYGTPWSTISPSVTCLYGDMVPPEKWYPAHYYKKNLNALAKSTRTRESTCGFSVRWLSYNNIYTKLRQWQGVRVKILVLAVDMTHVTALGVMKSLVTLGAT